MLSAETALQDLSVREVTQKWRCFSSPRFVFFKCYMSAFFEGCCTELSLKLCAAALKTGVRLSFKQVQGFF
jgi:hypothetical protein